MECERSRVRSARGGTARARGGPPRRWDGTGRAWVRVTRDGRAMGARWARGARHRRGCARVDVCDGITSRANRIAREAYRRWSRAWTMGASITWDRCRGRVPLGLCARRRAETRGGWDARRERCTRCERETDDDDARICVFFVPVVGSEQEARCHQGEATEEGTEGSDESALRAPSEELWHR